MHNVVALETNPGSGTCSANFKNVVRGSAGGCWVGGRGGGVPGGWGGCWTAQCPSPQMLKKIKRCERKGSESVTEEKCAVLFSCTVGLSPAGTTMRLQVGSAGGGGRGGLGGCNPWG